MLEARHFIIIFTDHKPITRAFQQKRNKCSPRQFNHIEIVAQFTTDIRRISGQDNVVADALSRVESVTAPPSYDAMAASQDSDDDLRTLLGSTTALLLEKVQIPVPWCPPTAIPLPGDLGRTFQLHYGSKCSSPPTIYRTREPKQRRSWSQSFLYGQACKRTAVPRHVIASPARAPKSPATQSLHWATSHRRQHVSCTFMYTSWDPFRRRWATHSASLQSIASPGHHSRHRGTRPADRLDIPLRLSADNRHRPGKSVRISTFPIPGQAV
jgi:hypothetical protein